MYFFVLKLITTFILNVPNYLSVREKQALGTRQWLFRRTSSGKVTHTVCYVSHCVPGRLLLRMSNNNYNMVILDKQGVDKMRYTYPITAAEIFTTIDTFPLRKEEMVLQQQADHTCQP